MKKYIITGVMAAVAATSAFAGTMTASKEVVEVAPPCLFRDQEFQVDLFGLGDFYRGNHSGNINGVNNVDAFSGRPAWGGGIGLNYFFTRFIGLGVEQSVFGRNTGAVNNYPGDFGYTRWATLGQLIFRYPICQWNLAPYAMIGGGALYGNSGGGGFVLTGGERYRLAGQGVGLVGGGLEYRITETIGVFSDARYLFSNVANLPNNQLMWRYGLRFAF